MRQQGEPYTANLDRFAQPLRDGAFDSGSIAVERHDVHESNCDRRDHGGINGDVFQLLVGLLRGGTPVPLCFCLGDGLGAALRLRFLLLACLLLFFCASFVFFFLRLSLGLGPFSGCGLFPVAALGLLANLLFLLFSRLARSRFLPSKFLRLAQLPLFFLRFLFRFLDRFPRCFLRFPRQYLGAFFGTALRFLAGC